MKRTSVNRPDIYENLSQILAELAVLRARDLRARKLDLDHYFILEPVATGRAHSDAKMVRRLGRNASFCSRAVDRLVKRGWLKKQPKRRGDDSRFQLKITRKGTRIYQDLQAGFAERVRHKLGDAPSRPKNMGPVTRNVALLNQMLRGVREGAAPPAKEEDDEMLQQPLDWSKSGGPEVS